jgi:hypothetical protein
MGDTSAALARPAYVHCDCKGGFGPESMGCTGCGGRCGGATTLSGCAGCSGCTMGDAVPLGGNADVVSLQRELNRFAGTLTQTVGITGVVDGPTANAAIVVLLARARDAIASGLDLPAGTALLAQVIGGVGDPVSFVSRSVGQITQIVSQYADVKGRPPAIGSLSKLPVAKLAVAGGIVAGLLLFVGRGRR